MPLFSGSAKWKLMTERNDFQFLQVATITKGYTSFANPFLFTLGHGLSRTEQQNV